MVAPSSKVFPFNWRYPNWIFETGKQETGNMLTEDEYSGNYLILNVFLYS
jgi:hypothetical protein